MKRMYFIFLLMIIACTSDELQPEPVLVKDTFEVVENTVTDKSAITITVSNLINHIGLINPIILICIKSHFNID